MATTRNARNLESQGERVTYASLDSRLLRRWSMRATTRASSLAKLSNPRISMSIQNKTMASTKAANSPTLI